MTPSGRALVRLRHWSRVLALRVVGTRTSPAQFGGWVGLFDELLTQRAEFDALKNALLARGVIGQDRYDSALEEAADANSALLAAYFAGARATDVGIEVCDPAQWAQTSAGWPA